MSMSILNLYSAILEIENSQYLRNHSTNRDEILRPTSRLWLQTVWNVEICIFLKDNMADGRHIENRKFSTTFDRSQKNLHKHADSGCKPCGKLNLAYFRNSRWRRALEMGFQHSINIRKYFCQGITLVYIDIRRHLQNI